MTPLRPHGRRRVPVEKLAAAERLLDDGCSVREVCKTVGLDKTTVNHHFPGRAWSRAQVCEFANTVRQINRGMA